MGIEAAGVVIEVGPGVTEVSVGDRVMGLFPEGTGSVATTDARVVLPIPADWGYAQGAGFTVGFATAFFALRGLADVQPGQSVLIHAGTGGVGMAAVQLARHWGLEVFATASRPQVGHVAGHGLRRRPHRRLPHPGLRAEVPGRHRRARGRRRARLAVGRLRRRLAAAAAARRRRSWRWARPTSATPTPSPRLTPASATARSTSSRRAPTAWRRSSTGVAALSDAGVLRPLPVSTWDVRRAPAALRHLSQARHIGKVVLTMPDAWAERHRPDHRWHRHGGRLGGPPRRRATTACGTWCCCRAADPTPPAPRNWSPS